MAGTAISGPGWIAAFLAELARTRTVARATAAAGVTSGSIYFQRNTNSLFADAWDAVLSGTPYEEALDELAAEPGAQKRANAGWTKPFLAALAETSNIKASAKTANVPLATVYRLRKADRQFAGDWQAALFEGYASLEMEVLGYLRAPDTSPKIDVANALRLLAAHKETITKERAKRASVSAAEVRASIERKVQVLRKQVEADEARRKS